MLYARQFLYYYSMVSKEEILNFVNSKILMVLSTVNSDGKPQSAVVGFGQTDSFELIFGTSVSSRKAKNIAANKNVSVVIGWDDGGTLQYEGEAHLLSENERAKYLDKLFEKNKKAELYKDNPEEIYYVISPKWLRFTQLTSYPWPVTEINF